MIKKKQGGHTMSRTIYLLLIAGLIFAGSAGISSSADINININPVPPPHFAFAAPPSVHVIPGSYVYLVPNMDFDMFFYNGYWYRPHNNYWYRAVGYNGPWHYHKAVPRPLLHLPSDYRRIPPGHTFIPYGQLKKHWRYWERDRYWDKKAWKYEEKGMKHDDRGRGDDDDKRHKDKKRDDDDRDRGKGDKGGRGDYKSHGRGKH